MVHYVYTQDHTVKERCINVFLEAKIAYEMKGENEMYSLTLENKPKINKNITNILN